MKNLMKTLMLCFILFNVTHANAQGRGINYQGTLRDIDGNLMVNEDITVIFEIRVGSGAGPSVYNETHTVTTNEYGGFNAIVNDGVVNSGNYYTIEWGAEHHFLNVNVNGNDLGTSLFQDVPYAQHANTAYSLVDPLWERGATSNEIYTEDKVTIGANSNNNQLLNVNAPDVLGPGELVDFNIDFATTNQDVLNLKVGAGSSDNAQYIECRKNTSLKFKVDVDGSVFADEDIETNGDLVVNEEVNASATGTTNLIPIAYGNVNANGTLNTNGNSGNISVTKATTGFYIITVAGETINFNDYAITVSPRAAFSGPRITNYDISTVGIYAGELQIYSYSLTGAYVDNAFSFTIYKP